MPSQDGPSGAPERSDHNPHPAGTVAAIDTSDPDLAFRFAQRELEALRSGVRAVAETLVRTGRVPEAEAQGMLRQLGVPLLERQQFRMEVPVAGVAVVDVMAADLTEARVIADSIVERGTGSMISTMLPGGSRLARMSRADHARIVGGKLPTGEEVTLS